MQDIQKQIEYLSREVAQATDRIELDALIAERSSLMSTSQAPDFWNDTPGAQETMKQIAVLDSRIQPWQAVQHNIQQVQELLELNDESLKEDILTDLKQAQREFAALKKELMFAGPYDDHNAILSLHAGAGGTDAQDWAEMLLRMYVRWAEGHNCRVKTIEQSVGEEAGIKSATLEIEGTFVYGKLKGEHGVHRLVRLSPFNADNLRQTSFAKVEVLPMINQPDEVALDEKELKIDVYRSGGHGGQSVNTTDSAVRITHIPTGIAVAIQNERSQLQNKETALTILRSKLAQLQLEQHAEKVSELKGPNQSAEWGNQIRSYVLHPYKQVKDLRSGQESSDPDKILNGELDLFIDAYLEKIIGQA